MVVPWSWSDLLDWVYEFQKLNLINWKIHWTCSWKLASYSWRTEKIEMLVFYDEKNYMNQIMDTMILKLFCLGFWIPGIWKFNNCFASDFRFPECYNSRLLAKWISQKTFQKVCLTWKGPKQNILIRDKISFVGVSHLTRGDRSCSWALYRSPPCTIEGF